MQATDAGQCTVSACPLNLLHHNHKDIMPVVPYLRICRPAFDALMMTQISLTCVPES